MALGLVVVKLALWLLASCAEAVATALLRRGAPPPAARCSRCRGRRPTLGAARARSPRPWSSRRRRPRRRGVVASALPRGALWGAVAGAAELAASAPRGWRRRRGTAARRPPGPWRLRWRARRRWRPGRWRRCGRATWTLLARLSSKTAADACIYS
ncbi:hypothetical protein EE612_011490 [Oryza sativa]|nr:hypothetical protein EE612_011490 [Oryza sativa]